jgi:putative phosphoribosyl transferase
MRERFPDRRSAGRELADGLRPYAHRDDVLVLALPRGGVPVAYEVARLLGVELDVLIVRKLGTPGQEELAMGAIASGGVLVREEGVLRYAGVSEAELRAIAVRERVELERRERTYREDRERPDLHGKTVILVDDGLATGATMRAAIQAVRVAGAKAVVVAVPVAQDSVVTALEPEVDDVVAVLRPTRLVAVGLWYDDFSQTEDEEVCDLLRDAGRHQYN